MCFNYRMIAYRTLMVSVIGLIVFLGFALSRDNSASKSIVLETNHLSTLSPHEHAEGDAVSDNAHHQYITSPVFIAPSDMWISRLAFSVHNAPETVIHHVSLLNWDEAHQTCSSLPFKQLFILAQDTMHHPFMDFPEGTGLRVRKGQHIQLSVMIHNPRPPAGPGGTYTDVYGQLTITTLPRSSYGHLKEIKPYLLHVDDAPCVITEPDQSDAYVFSVPPKSAAYTFAGGSSPFNPGVYLFKSTSTIVYIGAHLHGWQGGKEVLVEKNGSPLLSFDTVRSLDDPYRYDTRYYPTALEMKPGDSLRIRAVYNNPNSVPIRGAMGDLGIYFFEHE